MNGNIIKPNYDKCILSTISSLLKYYNIETNYKSLESLDNLLIQPKKNIILLILDGLGEHILNSISSDNFLYSHKIDTVTSVYPSTTTAAMTSYYSGKAPFETGWIAWSQYFKEYGRAIDMFSRKESYQNDSLNNVKFNVFKDVVNYQTIFSKIEDASNIKTFEVMPTYCDRRANRTIKADNIDEVVESIEFLCKIPDEKFIMAYLDDPDNTLHKFGTNSEEAAKIIKEIESKIQEMINKIPSDSLLVISADHGHKNIEKSYNITDYPELQECFIIPPSLESRCMTFWIKDNMKEEFKKRFNSIFKDEYMLLSKEEFLNENYLGYGNKHIKVDDFLGNFVAISIASSAIKLETFLNEGKEIKKSTHCGLTKEEMEVPVIAIEK